MKDKERRERLLICSFVLELERVRMREREREKEIQGWKRGQMGDE